MAMAAGALGGRRHWWWITITGAVIAGVLRALVDNPYLDPSCETCLPNALAIAHHPAIATALVVAGTFTIAIGCLGSARHAPRPWPLVTLAGISAATIWWPEARAVAVGLGVAVIGIEVVESFAARAQLRSLVDVFDTSAGLQHVLRKALVDPDLSVSYPVGAEQRLVGSDGGAAPERAAGQATSELRTATGVVAVVHHRCDAATFDRFASAIGAPARLALEHEWLNAELASRAIELSWSRTHIVELGDAERLRVERDVHDGAQQHVLALGFDLRARAADSMLDADTRATLVQCVDETKSALDDLRNVSHGLYPPSLVGGGLHAALGALSRRSAASITIQQLPTSRPPIIVERTIYALVADVADIANSAMPIVVAVESTDTGVAVEINGVEHAVSQDVIDRLDALDSRVVHHHAILHVEIPCVQ
jgi:signal transduction histidine kinase